MMSKMGARGNTLSLFKFLVWVIAASFPSITTPLPFRSRKDEDPAIVEVKSGAKHRSATVESFLSTPRNEKELFGTLSNQLVEEIREKAHNLTDFLVETRRALHKHPELMYQEDETSAAVQTILKEWGVAFTTGWAVNTHPDAIPGSGGFGIVANIGTGNSPCVMLRADMDALPINEQTNNIESFKSQYPGKMHACGHDSHVVMLLGAVSVLKSIEDSLSGTVRIMFQPAEEGGAGAKRMIEEGLLRNDPPPSHAFGIHVWPTLPSGVIAGRPGPLLAAAERFTIFLQGVGGHAAMPHLAVDPVVCAAGLVMNLQSIISRTISPLEAGVISVTEIHAGEAFNIIPDRAIVKGTIRALSTETLLDLRNRLETMVNMTAAAFRLVDVNVSYSPDYYPPTVNDPDLYEEFSKHVGALVSLEGVVRDTEPTMGAEDFSFVAEQIPSTFFLLGSGSGAGHHHSPQTDYGLHHPQFALDESVMPKGVELHVNLAIRALHKLRHADAATKDQ